MTLSTGQRKPHFKNVMPSDPDVKPMKSWPMANKGFYADFRAWLRAGGYGATSLNTYGVAARLAIGYLDLPYWQIDPQADLERVKIFLRQTHRSPCTCQEYDKGLIKLAEYLRLRCHKPAPVKTVNWAYYTASLPAWLIEQLQAYVAHRRRSWTPERQHRATLEVISHLTLSLRWIVAITSLDSLADITPDLWFDYLEMRLAAGITPTTLNSALRHLQAFLIFMSEAGNPMCQRMLRVGPLAERQRLPRDVPSEQLRILLDSVRSLAGYWHAGLRRMGLVDHAWILLMLHCGLRTCEVRRLKLGDIDWERRAIRIEQSKGLKDRIVYLSREAHDALQSYLAVRGPSSVQLDYLFIYRHQPLSYRYCQVRLRTFGRKCGVQVTPHQLRHSCASLLLNAGAPILAVQAILGHKHIDTTLNYARLYDGTLAADYHRAMVQVEARLALAGEMQPVPDPNELLALVDLLQAGSLDMSQIAALERLRSGLLALTGQGIPMSIGDVKVPTAAP